MQLKFIVVIPVYNHSGTVIEVIQSCLSEVSYDILVVDDASDISVQELYSKVDNVSDRVRFLRHEKNRGKGAALQSAIQVTVAEGYTHMITVDADGQHLASDMPKMIEAAQQNPWALILGDRQMKTQNVPKSSVFGKAFSNFWIKYETDSQVGDSQSGYRIYPLFFVQTMSFRCQRYDFEIEVLTRLIWNNVKVVSVPISVVYFPGDLRVTHFHKIKDNLRLVVLNTVLVTSSLLKRNDSPVKSALALAIGVFVGCFPIYGLHTLIVMGMAFAFKINFVYLFLGTQISIPPLVPFLVLGASGFSNLITGHSPKGFFGLSSDWLTGITALAMTCSVILGFLVYFIKHKNLRNQKIAIQSKDGIGIKILAYFLKHQGLRFVYFCLYFVVPFYFIFSGPARKSSRELYYLLNSDPSFLKRQLFYWRRLFVFAQVLVDRAYQKMVTVRQFEIIELDHLDSFKSRIESDQGLVVMQSHFGGWELSFTYFQHMKSHKKMSAVMYGEKSSFTHSSARTMGSSDKLAVHFYNQQMGTTAHHLKESLLKGDIIGMMADRPVGRSYELLPVLGKLMLIDTSPFRMAQLSKVSLYSLFCIKKNDFQYEVSLIEIDQSQSIEQSYKAYTTHLEKILKAYPEQWFNFYPVWSKKLF
jgi:predicted LPLAT superfamily acyltransferase/uncharacterized protein (DUF2062 family)